MTKVLPTVPLRGWIKIYAGSAPSVLKPKAAGCLPYVKVDDLNIGAKYQTESREYVDEAPIVVPRGAILFPKRGAAISNNKVRIAARDVCLDTNVMGVETLEGLDPEYFYYAITHERLYRIADTSTIPQLNNKHLNGCKLWIPPLRVQRRIAEVLGRVDSYSDGLASLIETKRTFKRGLMQQLLTGRKRFPEFHSNAWGSSRLGDHVLEVKRKNTMGVELVLTASGEHGLVDQRRYFNRSVSGADLSRYWLLKAGEFAYNRSAMNGYPYGATKRLHEHDQGVLSTLYLCFAITDPNLNSDFVTHVFESGVLNRQLRLIVRVGARAHGLLNVANEDFLSINIPFPSPDEQFKIAGVLSDLDRELDLLTAQRLKVELQKSGLLSRLLSGELEVCDS